nr:hypothetical protein [Lachnospiraceae bacterium]
MEHDKKRVAIVSTIFVLLLITGLASASISQRIAKPLPYISQSNDTGSNSFSLNPLATRTTASKISAKGDDLILSFAKLENNEQNIIYSPLAVKYALCMLNDGTSGTTKKELNDKAGTLSPPVYGDVEDHISFFNTMFINDTFNNHINTEFSDKITSSYNGDIIYDSFMNSLNINNLVKDNTLGLINDI